MSEKKSYTTIDILPGSSGTNAVGQLVFGPFTFDYINKNDIKFVVKVGGTWKAITVDSVDTTAKTVTLAAAPSHSDYGADDSSEGRIYRATTLDPIVDFQKGSRISEADLDNAYRQGLFAAQEVAEDANTTGGSGTTTLTAGSVQNVHMADNAIQNAELDDNAVNTAEIANGAVTADKLAATLNLSSKTSVVLPNDSVTAAMLEDNIDLSGATLPEESGSVLECIHGICDGTTANKRGGGTYTLPTIHDGGGVPRGQDLTSSFAEITSSSFEYTPPDGTTRVSYEYSFVLAPYGRGDWDSGMQRYSLPTLAHFQFFLGEQAGSTTLTEVTGARFSAGTSHFYGDRVTFKWVIGIGNGPSGGAVSAQGILAAATGGVAQSGWTSNRKMVLKAQYYMATNEGNSDTRYARLHESYWWDDNAYNSDSETVSYPTLTITAVK